MTTSGSTFLRRLRAINPRPDDRRWQFVPYDQLSDRVGPLARTAPEEAGIVLVECPAKAARRPYHKQKLALLLANMRHFALEQAARGVAVKYVVADSYAEAIAGLGPIAVMRPAERELRTELASLVESGALTEIPHEGWLTTRDDFLAAERHPPWRMDRFYRFVRRRLDVLMHAEKPVGGRFSFDGENRKPWRGSPPPPTPPAFDVDEITAEVSDLVRSRFARHPGKLTPEAIPATSSDAALTWQWAQRACLPHFGPFEDAMSSQSRSLFHTRVSPLLNLQRLTAHQLLADVLALEIPIESKEGFVRQLLGWREFMHHVHEATDGFRRGAGHDWPTAETVGDGGYRHWSGEGPDRKPERAWWLAGVRVGLEAERAAGVLGQAVGPPLPRPGRQRGVGRGLQSPHHPVDGAGQHRHAPRRLAA